MNYKNFIIGILLIAIPLIILILCYKNYVYKYCKYDIQCLSKMLNESAKMRNSSNQNSDHKSYEQNSEQNSDHKSYEQNSDHKSYEQNSEQIEGFLGGFSDWFSGSTPANLPVSAGTVGNENLNTLEKKINDKMSISNKFPPTNLNGNSDDFKDSDNSDILNSIGSKPYMPNNMLSSLPPPPPPPSNKPKADISITVPPKIIPEKSLLDSCQFYNDKCPDKYKQLGNFSIEGIGSSSILSCGNVQNTKPAHAIAQIKNNSVYEIHITDQGHGFNPSKVPKISIEGGKGHGATAEAVIDDDGFLKLIKVINPGYNYTETPNILIDAPYMNSSCYLCCKEN